MQPLLFSLLLLDLPVALSFSFSSFSFVTVILELIGLKKPAFWRLFTQMTANVVRLVFKNRVDIYKRIHTKAITLFFLAKVICCRFSLKMSLLLLMPPIKKGRKLSLTIQYHIGTRLNSYRAIYLSTIRHSNLVLLSVIQYKKNIAGAMKLYNAAFKWKHFDTSFSWNYSFFSFVWLKF